MDPDRFSKHDFTQLRRTLDKRSRWREPRVRGEEQLDGRTQGTARKASRDPDSFPHVESIRDRWNTERDQCPGDVCSAEIRGLVFNSVAQTCS